MESTYDLKAWEQVTTLGRRLYIYNFGMNGAEFDGWELADTSTASHSPGESEKIFLWKRVNGEGQLIQVRVIECGCWRDALQVHHDQLMRSNRPDIPRGEGKTAGIGDIQHVGQVPSGEVEALVFTRGNLQISVSSMGFTAVDVSELAQALDDLLTGPPAGPSESLTGKARKKEMTVLIDKLPEPTTESGWTRVLAPDGEILREGDSLYLLEEKGGDRTVEMVRYRLE